MKRGIILILLFFLIICLDFAFLLLNLEETGKIILENDEEKYVTKIIDGDTVIVEGGQSVRLLGIDCDEKGKKCFTIAKNRIEELLLGKKVVLVSEGEDKDMYDRQLRYIMLNGEDINEKMVKEGYCVARFVGDEYSNYKEDIIVAERYALENKVGCKWS